MNQKYSKIISEGPDQLFVLADFDRTLTYGSVNGQKTPSIISLLRDGKHLSEEYGVQANKFYDKYSVIENDLSLDLAFRKAKMQEWWEVHNQYLIDCGLKKSDLQDIVDNGGLKLREGVAEFLKNLHSHGIPLIICSASGCGDAIIMYLQKLHLDFDNIYYAINQFNFDESGRAVSTKGQVIHSLNKDETAIINVPGVAEAIKDRNNILLLGDSIGDLGMANGFVCENLLSVGFLNFDLDKYRLEYQQNFDLVIEGDGGFSQVNEIINSLVV